MSIFQFISRWRALALLVPAIGLGSFLEADALSVRPAANHPEALCGLPSVTLDRRQALVRGTIAATTGLIASGVIPPFVASADAIPPTIAPIATLSDGGAFPLASFGLQIYDDDTAYKLTLTALEVCQCFGPESKGLCPGRARQRYLPRSTVYLWIGSLEPSERLRSRASGDQQRVATEHGKVQLR